MVAGGRAVTYSIFGDSPLADSIDTRLFQRGHTLVQRGPELVLIAEERFLGAPLPPSATMVMAAVPDCRIADLPPAQARIIVGDGNWLPETGSTSSPYVITAADHLSAVVAELLLGPPRGVVPDARREEFVLLQRRRQHLMDQMRSVEDELAACVDSMEGGWL